MQIVLACILTVLIAFVLKRLADWLQAIRSIEYVLFTLTISKGHRLIHLPAISQDFVQHGILRGLAMLSLAFLVYFSEMV